MAEPADPWLDALTAARLLALDPLGLGGAALHGPPGTLREAWLAELRAALPAGAPWRRLPQGTTEGRLLGGLDLAATLAAGRPIAERGVLAEADGGVVLAAMAERMAPGIAAQVAGVLDRHEMVAERDGLALRAPARIALVALDEGIAAEEVPPAALLERLAFRLDLGRLDARNPARLPPADIEQARALLPQVSADDSVIGALCSAAIALGVDSLRAPLLALRVARAAAALDGRPRVNEEDAALAARLVLAPRATRLPAEAEEEPEPEPPPPEPPPPETEQEQQEPPSEPEQAEMLDLLLAAAVAALPPNLLNALRISGAARSGGAGKAGAAKASPKRGRPIGTRAGLPGNGNRLALVETLRAAAPWQKLRGREGARLEVRRDDLRIRRFKARSETATIFAVDASGSSALNRMAEAKGAVELLLADCYVRRDQVALLAFRGTAAELLLPPTGSLVRAKRSLAALPGGGGTPIAAALDAALALADAVRRKGQTPLLVLLTDGRANVARDGKGGRPRAEAEALEAATALRLARVAAVLVDTSPRPQEQGRRLADAMGAKYLPLPYADAATLSRAVKAEAA